MGNWRRVQIQGTCSRQDVPKLHAALDPGNDYLNFHCLSGGGGVCALPNWAAETIQAVGNLAERDFSPEDVFKVLKTKLLPVAPSLAVLIHCGDENEGDRCIASIIAAFGHAVIGPPCVEAIPPLDEGAMRSNLFSQLLRPRV